MLAELAKLTALDEGSPQAFRVRAYENALHGIEGYQGELTGLDKKELTEIKGVGGSTADKILEFMSTGSVAKLVALREKYPPAFVELTKIPGLGPKTLKVIRAELGVEDIDGLRAAIAAERLRDLTLRVYARAEEVARAKGIILADTKLEMGRRPDGTVVLADEVLTPDSSRFWPADRYEPGRSQPSFDKQYVRDWLDQSGWNHTPPGPELPADVVAETRAKYVEAYERISGRSFDDWNRAADPQADRRVS